MKKEKISKQISWLVYIQRKNLWLNLLWTFGYLHDSLQLHISREIMELGKKILESIGSGERIQPFEKPIALLFSCKNASGNSVQELFPKRLLSTRDFPHWFCTLRLQDTEAVPCSGWCPNSYVYSFSECGPKSKRLVSASVIQGIVN